MRTLSAYCKAYPLARFREFPEWTENAAAAREEHGAPRPLDEASVLYLHDNREVTDGIFRGEHVIFSSSSPQWVEFCRTRLEFAPPSAD